MVDDKFNIIDKHHLIPKEMHELSYNAKNNGKTIDLCATCHKIAHIIIKNAIMHNPFVEFWEEEELVKAGRRFRKENLRKMGKY
jgi:hypothetical protein